MSWFETNSTLEFVSWVRPFESVRSSVRPCVLDMFWRVTALINVLLFSMTLLSIEVIVGASSLFWRRDAVHQCRRQSSSNNCAQVGSGIFPEFRGPMPEFIEEVGLGVFAQSEQICFFLSLSHEEHLVEH